MTGAFSQRMFAARTMLARANERGDLLILAFAVLFAPLLFSNDYTWAPKLFFSVFVPTAVMMWIGFGMVVKWPTARLHVVFKPEFAFSVIIAAAFVYLLSMNLSSWSQPAFSKRLLDQQWAYAGEILLFMAIAAHGVANRENFLVRLITVLMPLVAVSALINVWVFFSNSAAGTELLAVRLVNCLGMPGYTNSTNISVTYAVYFIAGFAAAFDRRSGLALKLWLAPFLPILLAAMLLTQSRSAYIGTAIGAVAIVLVARDRAYWKKRGLAYAVAFAIVGVALASAPQIRDAVTARGESRRPEIWSIYLGKAVAKPLLGYGGLSNIDITIADGAVIDQPHNVILSAQIRGGIFCMLAMVAMLIASAWWALRYWKLRSNAIPLGMIATMIPTAMFDYNLLVTPATWPWVTFWLPFAVCAGAEIAVRRSGWETSPPGPLINPSR